MSTLAETIIARDTAAQNATAHMPFEAIRAHRELIIGHLSHLIELDGTDITLDWLERVVERLG